MNKEFVSYKTALALKELGFDEPCFTVYNGTNILIRLTGKPVGWCFIDEVELIKHNSSVGSLGVTAPTYSQAFRWFREKYDLPSHIAIYWQPDWNNYSYEWNIVENHKQWNVIEHFKTYEEAESACLDKLIEICKTKTNE